MSISQKYGRSFHFSFSEGTTSDDRINFDWEEDITKFATALHTEKMDGENSCLSELGVFARSHAAPTIHPWADYLKIKQSQIKNDLKSCKIEIFGENLYAIHSIIYPRIEEHFYVFGIRCLDRWLSWEETKWYASVFDMQVVPELSIQETKSSKAIETQVKQYMTEESVFGSLQNDTGLPCTREGIVTRNIESYGVDEFNKNLFKCVRKGHVQTEEHWSKKWKRAPLKHEIKQV